VRFPKRIRLGRESYANRESQFHLIVHAHPGVQRLATKVADAVWGTVMEQRAAGRVELSAACLMPDHLHLLVAPRDMDLIAFLNAWKSWSTHKAKEAGHIGSLWQPGMWDRTCRNQEDFETVAQYIVSNPVVGGMVEEPEAWPHSWARWWENGVV